MDESKPEMPTLASLRRRSSRRRPAPDAESQPDLFSRFTTAAEESFPAALTPGAVQLLRADCRPVQLPDTPDVPWDRAVHTQDPAFPISPHQANAHLAPPPQAPPPRTLDQSRNEAVLTVHAETTLTAHLSVTDRLAEDELPPSLPQQTWSVSGLVRHVRGLVERGYGQVTVEGEISNWRPAGSGHCYFTVKDAGAQLSAVMFRRQAALVRFRPNDGDAVRLHGQLSIYESRGQMQLIVEWMEQVGLGALLAAVQRLKERLRREGLFDRQRPLPPFPRCIGLVTSLQGAALRDIIKVCRRRHAAVQILIYPAAVQGPNCPAEVAAGVRWFSAHPERAEVVLVARGGGSWEDLHGFDDEGIARAIAACPLPVITGIGHAPDATVADAAADVCAPTPSAAAELLTAGQHRIEERVERLHSRLLRAGNFELLRAQGRFARLGANTVLRRVEDSLNRRSQRADELQFRAEAALRDRLRHAGTRLSTATARLERQSPAVRLGATHRRLETVHLRLGKSLEYRLREGASRIDRCLTRLEAMSPLRVLERGYALVYGPDGHLLRSPVALGPGDAIAARLAEGTLRARVVS